MVPRHGRLTRVRLVYLGSPEAAVAPLEALVDAGHTVQLVVTGPPRRRGRRSEPTPTPVGAAAERFGLPVAHDPDAVLDVDVDLGVVVAYGRLLRSHHLAAVPMVNLHFSLLPRWRGAAPVERAILAGDPVTGVCLMQVEEGLDTGPVYACEEVQVDDLDADELRAQLVGVGSRLLVDQLSAGLRDPRPQSERGVTYAAKVTQDDLRLDWSAPCQQVRRVVRVGGAWTTLRGERLKVHALGESGPAPEPAPGAGTVLDGGRVACGDGTVRLEVVQPAGRARMSARDWMNGTRPTGEVLGT